MPDLHTASYFCAWLKSPPLDGDASSHHTQPAGRQRILDTYAACGVSLTELIPQVIQRVTTCNNCIKSAACIPKLLQCHDILELQALCFCTCSMTGISVL